MLSYLLQHLTSFHQLWSTSNDHSNQQSWRSVLEILPLFQHLTSLHPVRSIPKKHSIQQSWRSVVEILPLFQHLTSLHPVRSIPINTRFNNRGDLFSRSSLSSNISHHCIQSGSSPRKLDSTIVEICSRDPPSLPTSHIIASSQEHAQLTLDSTIVEICSRDPPSLPTSHIIASSQNHSHDQSIQQSWFLVRWSSCRIIMLSAECFVEPFLSVWYSESSKLLGVTWLQGVTKALMKFAFVSDKHRWKVSVCVLNVVRFGPFLNCRKTVRSLVSEEIVEVVSVSVALSWLHLTIPVKSLKYTQCSG